MSGQLAAAGPSAVRWAGLGAEPTARASWAHGRKSPTHPERPGREPRRSGGLVRPTPGTLCSHPPSSFCPAFPPGDGSPHPDALMPELLLPGQEPVRAGGVRGPAHGAHTCITQPSAGRAPGAAWVTACPLETRSPRQGCDPSAPRIRHGRLWATAPSVVVT